jgi:uncharacterized Rmd1/YagE family protein
MPLFVVGSALALLLVIGLTVQSRFEEAIKWIIILLIVPVGTITIIGIICKMFNGR